MVNQTVPLTSDNVTAKLRSAAHEPLTMASPHLTLITMPTPQPVPTEADLPWYCTRSYGIVSYRTPAYVVCTNSSCTRTKIGGHWVEQADFPRGPNMPVVTGCCNLDGHGYTHYDSPPR